LTEHERKPTTASTAATVTAAAAADSQLAPDHGGVDCGYAATSRRGRASHNTHRLERELQGQRVTQAPQSRGTGRGGVDESKWRKKTVCVGEGRTLVINAKMAPPMPEEAART
jgi:hypothetical protein